MRYALKEVMTSEVVTVSPDITMRELMRVLRIKKISGVPVVARGNLIGIISLEDLVKAVADSRHSQDTVGDRMTRKLVVLRADELAVQAVNLFAQHGYGRLPIVDNDGKLVGILTGSDITRGTAQGLEPALPGGRDTPLPRQPHFRGYRFGADESYSELQYCRR